MSLQNAKIKSPTFILEAKGNINHTHTAANLKNGNGISSINDGHRHIISNFNVKPANGHTHALKGKK